MARMVVLGKMAKMVRTGRMAKTEEMAGMEATVIGGMGEMVVAEEIQINPYQRIRSSASLFIYFTFKPPQDRLS